MPRRGYGAAPVQRGLDARVVGALELVRSRVNRDHGTGAASLLAYAPEPQQRGAIHFHIVFGAGSPRERAALDDIAHDLATIGAGYGWGRVHLPEADEARKRPDGRPPAASRSTKLAGRRAT